LTSFDAIVVQVQMSFTKIEIKNNVFWFFFGEFLNIHISHLTRHSTINMALKWHHKNIYNKITVFIEFWRLLDMFFGSIDYGCTQNHVSLIIYILYFFMFTLLLHTHIFTLTKGQCTNMVPCKCFIGVWVEVYILYIINP
jgi:hypothetical protein